VVRVQATERELGKYLVKAQRAEHVAAKFAPESESHNGWLKIAEGYRQLAEEEASPKRRMEELS
jgi:hypothetical protein